MALAAPGASAKTVHKVFAGSFVPPVFGELTSFYPQSTDVHVGDSVKFAAGGFHTVTFLPSGAPRAPLFGQIHDTYGTELDAAGNPFWFSNAGLQKYLVNPDYFLPSASTTVDGSTLVNSGAGFSKFTVTFSQLGTFKFFCAIHPKMTGTVHVIPKNRAIRPGQAERAQKQMAADAADATAFYAHSSSLPSNSKTVQVAPGNRRAILLQFFPSAVTAKVGQVVNFVWQGNNELHTVTFGPDDYIDELGNGFVGPDLVVDARAIFPSEPGNPNPVDLSPASHGNGFVNSGLIGDPGTAPYYFGSAPPAPGNSFRVRFTQPGTYHFECLIHVGLMEGEVTVTP